MGYWLFIRYFSIKIVPEFRAEEFLVWRRRRCCRFRPLEVVPSNVGKYKLCSTYILTVFLAGIFKNHVLSEITKSKLPFQQISIPIFKVPSNKMMQRKGRRVFVVGCGMTKVIFFRYFVVTICTNKCTTSQKCSEIM